MSLIGEKRKKMILNLLYSKGNIITAELVRLLDVSKESVRRYMDELESEGKLKKVYGGAVKLVVNCNEPPHLERMALHLEEKDRVGRCAAEIVRDNSTGASYFSAGKFMPSTPAVRGS